jgi:hypothetical protein
MAGVTNFVKSNIGTIGAGAAGIGIGAVLGGSAVYALTKSRKKSKRKSVRKRNTKNRRSKTRKKKYYPRTAGKRKDRSTKRIRFTKTGQPYVLMASGKARFIKKSSAKNSRRRKGGRY